MKQYIISWWGNPALRIFTLGVLLFTVLAVLPRVQYGFWIAMLWNLFLVMVPVVAAFGAYMTRSLWARSVQWCVAFFFIPNTWYVITDLRHLIWLHPKPDGVSTIVREGWDALAGGNVWMSEILLFLLATLGVFGGAYAGYMLVRIVAERMRYGSMVLRIHMGAIILSYLSGIAIYIGRYIRLNSWDIIAQPITVITEILRAHHDPQMLFVTGLYGAIAYLSILTAWYIHTSYTA